MATNERASLAGPTQPPGSPEIPQFHAPATRQGGLFAPYLYGAARVEFADRRRKFSDMRRVAFVLRLDPATPVVDWDLAQATPLMPEDLGTVAPASGGYLPLPLGAMELKTFTRWARSFDRWLARTQRVELPPRGDETGPVQLGPKRGGVSVELVALLWDLD